MSEPDTPAQAAGVAQEDETPEAPVPRRRSRSASRSRAAGNGGRSLVIVESPAKAETISRFLDDDYVVDASYGHVRDLPGSAEERPEEIKGQWWADLGVNVDADFAPVYIVPDDKRRHIDRLKKELQKADRLLVATDEDREGESIGWHLLEILKPSIPVQRIVFHEVTQEAIENALRNPRAIDRDLVEAQESRRILDRLFGYSLSPVLWRKIKAGLSAGRVQSVAVRLLVERERERAAFHAATYWDAEADLEASGGRFPATLRRLAGRRMPSGRDFDPATGRLTAAEARSLSEAEIMELVGVLAGREPWTITKIESSPVTRRPQPPFTTSTLQQEANRRLGFGASRTMQVAQSLYEGVDIGAEREGLITYMRTDSVNLADSALREAQEVIEREFGADHRGEPRRYRGRTKNAQEAHEGIRPTHLRRTPQSLRTMLTQDQYRLYDLIWRRTLASQMPDARLERTGVEITVDLPGRADDDPAIFEARGQRVLFAGFLRALDDDAEDDSERLLPPIHEGDVLQLRNLEPKRHDTQPPARYTEASLVRKLEEEGLGRPSTYAAVLSTIQARGYVFKQGNALVPSFLAFAVTELLERHFRDLVEPNFTAQMEDTLDAIARGETDAVSHLRAFYYGDGNLDGTGLRGRIDDELPHIEFPLLELGEDNGGNRLAVRIGRFGPYIQRGEGGEGNTASLPPDLAPADLTPAKAEELLTTQQEGPRNLGRDPETDEEVTVQTGRYGPYVQLGPNPPRGKKGAPKPKRASVPPGTPAQEVTLEDALLWLSLPRTLGKHPESGEEIIAQSGRYGPYIQMGKESRSLEDHDDVYTIELPRALELLAQPKRSFRRRAQQQQTIKELGKHPTSGADVKILNGRFGPYITDGETNASVPRGMDPATVTMETAVDLLAQRAAAPKRGKSTRSAASSRGGKTRARTSSRGSSSRKKSS